MAAKVLFATGAARGLGRAIVERFLKDGYQVLAFDVDANNLAEASEAWGTGESVLTIVGDVTKREQVQGAVDAAVSRWGGIHVLANVAGIAIEEAFLDIQPENWQRIIDVNLTGMFNVAQIVARQMVENDIEGVILNMSSKNGIDAEVKYAHYNASKAGVILLTKTMAVDLAPNRIRVNAIAPGYTLTPLTLEMDAPDFMDFYRNRLIPLGRLGNPQDVAGAFAFLAGDDAKFITGHTLVIDGGQLSHDGRLMHSYIPGN
ncbi:MAG: SDR family oxidoreductase [Anaerolineae bacterium]|nr:SDR family oxidoreductase [Anaerolineae bacterium]